ncbi:MAG TPA: DUF5320 domain-containing protein [Anaerolineae bacterium]|nr:DUF5320 domain-containing protein [Anaerolineae bacterium]HOQ98637.1 DUF5320 domain-containing protein [Anaerolineae bacterium]HPL28251.1 DUF5320 domain-containing protein [Anaerolineae bacterium]
MPRGDGTGPTGMGPRTGRGLGPCANYPTPGNANPGAGRSFDLSAIGRWAVDLLPRLGLGRRRAPGQRRGRSRGRRS